MSDQWCPGGVPILTDGKWRQSRTLSIGVCHSKFQSVSLLIVHCPVVTLQDIESSVTPYLVDQGPCLCLDLFSGYKDEWDSVEDSTHGKAAYRRTLLISHRCDKSSGLHPLMSFYPSTILKMFSVLSGFQFFQSYSYRIKIQCVKLNYYPTIMNACIIHLCLIQLLILIWFTDIQVKLYIVCKNVKYWGCICWLVVCEISEMYVGYHHCGVSSQFGLHPIQAHHSNRHCK